MSLAKDERGQALLFAAVTLFAVATFVGLVYNVGEVAAGRVGIQHAADAAAYSGALVQADLCSAVGWLNEGMAYVYFNAMRHAVDTCVLGTLSELKDRGATDTVVGVSDVYGKYETAYDKAAERIPQCETWLSQINDMQDAIALSAPALVKKEVWRVARANGAEKIAMFPDLEYFPDPDNYQEIEIEDMGGGDWRLTVVEGAYAGYILQIENLGPHHWKISCMNGMDSEWIEIQELANDYYKITGSDGNWFTFRKTGDDRVDIVTSQGFEITSMLTEIGWMTSGSNGSENFSVTPTGGGAFTINSSQGTVHVRPTEDGVGYEQNVGNGWQPVATPESVNVDGRDFPVSISNRINIGSGPQKVSVWIPDVIHVGNMRYNLPRTVTVGPAQITIMENDVRVTAGFGPAHVSIDGGGNFGIGHKWYMLHRGGQDDSIWRSVPRGTWRHRLSIPENNRWTYQWVKEAAYFTRDNGERFGVTHAVRDHDPYVAGTGSLPPYVAWWDPKTGKPVSGTDYYQTRTCWQFEDLHCPYHGNDAAPEPNGYWHEMQGNRMVRKDCPLCRGRNYDDDPETEVRVYLEDAYDRKGTNRFERDDFMAVDMQKFRKPLVLTESLFKFGVNIAVWKKRPEIPFSVGLTSGAPRWGFVAFASAKAGFWDVRKAEHTYQFDNAAERQQWLDSFPNLYEPSWQARLWSMRRAILNEDIDVTLDPDSGEIVQSGANYLLHRLKQSYWFETYEQAVGGPRGDRRHGHLGAAPGDLGRISAPGDWGGGNLNLFSGRELDEVIRH
jgi:hypothetical protein